LHEKISKKCHFLPIFSQKTKNPYKTTLERDLAALSGFFRIFFKQILKKLNQKKAF